MELEKNQATHSLALVRCLEEFGRGLDARKVSGVKGVRLAAAVGG